MYYRVWDPEGKEYIDMLSAYSYVLSTIYQRAIVCNSHAFP